MQGNKTLKYSVLALFVSAALLPLSASARHYTFNSALIDGGKGDVDVSLFSEGLQLPGIYNVTVTVNGNTVDSDVAVPFRLSGEGKQRTLHPCLTAEQLTLYGVDISGYPALSADVQCVDPEVIPQSTADFDFNRQQLSLVFPPQAMLPALKGIAPETLWDDGIPALMLGWDASTQHSEYRGPSVWPPCH